MSDPELRLLRKLDRRDRKKVREEFREAEHERRNDRGRRSYDREPQDDRDQTTKRFE